MDLVRSRQSADAEEVGGRAEDRRGARPEGRDRRPDQGAARRLTFAD